MKKQRTKLSLKKTTVKKLNITETKAVEGGSGPALTDRSFKPGTFGCCQATK